MSKHNNIRGRKGRFVKECQFCGCPDGCGCGGEGCACGSNKETSAVGKTEPKWAGLGPKTEENLTLDPESLG